MNAQSAHWFILVLINIPVFLGLGKIIFKDWGSFLEALRLWSSADWWHSLEKQWHLDRWGTSQLPLFLLLCVAIPVLEHLMFGKTSVVRPAAQVVWQLRSMGLHAGFVNLA